jgi:hypothetical protein
MNPTPANVPPAGNGGQTPDNAAPVATPCDHEWKFCDESFDHAFGTERVHFFRCEKCDAERPVESSDYHEPRGYYEGE